MAEENKSYGLAWFLAGLGVGALVGILYAPKSGKETREDIANSAREGTEYLRVKTREAAENVSALVDKSKEQVSAIVDKGKEQVTEYVDRGSDAIDRGRAQWEEFVERGKNDCGRSDESRGRGRRRWPPGLQDVEQRAGYSRVLRTGGFHRSHCLDTVFLFRSFFFFGAACDWWNKTSRWPGVGRLQSEAARSVLSQIRRVAERDHNHANLQSSAPACLVRSCCAGHARASDRFTRCLSCDAEGREVNEREARRSSHGGDACYCNVARTDHDFPRPDHETRPKDRRGKRRSGFGDSHGSRPGYRTSGRYE